MEEKEQLNNIDELKNAIISTISHELRTPLVSIRGYAEIMKSGSLGPVTDKQEKSINIILRNVDKLVNLITDLLDYSNIVSNHNIQLKKEIFTFSDVFNEIIAKLKSIADERKITVSCDIDHSIIVEADKNKIERILYNIIHNSIKFNRDNGIIEIVCQKKDNKVYLEFTDSGIGISKDKIDKIFDTFFQIDSASTRKYDGAGIGLSIVKEFIYLHKGKFKILSDLEKSTKFIVELPILLTRNRMTQNIIPMLQKKLIFLFCKDQIFLTSLKKILSDCGFNIIISDDKKEMNSMITKYNPDIFLNFICENDNGNIFENEQNIKIPFYLSFSIKNGSSGMIISFLNFIKVKQIAVADNSQYSFEQSIAIISSALTTLEYGNKKKIIFYNFRTASDDFGTKEHDFLYINDQDSYINGDIAIFNNFETYNEYSKSKNQIYEKFFIISPIFANLEIQQNLNNQFFKYDLDEDTFVELICRIYLVLLMK